MQIVPDEIHIAIELRERGNGANKTTIEKQEMRFEGSDYKP